MLVSFLLARRLHGITYVSLVISNVLLISFLSAGIPRFGSISKDSADVIKSGILIDNPLPLSYPIHASLHSEIIAFDADAQYYELYFLTLMFYKNSVQRNMAGWILLDMSWGDYILFCSFFVLVNIVGAVIGYWLSRRTFIDRLSKPVKRIGPAAIVIALTVTSLYLFYEAYQIWSGYDWAMQRLQVPIPVEDAFLFRQLLWAIVDYVSLFPVYFLLGLTFGTFAIVIVVRNSRRRALIIVATTIVSSAFLFFEAYKIWEIHHLATHQVFGSSLAYLSYAHHEATYVYQTLFWLYLLSGSIAVASGIIMITLGRLKAKLREYRLKRQESNGILV